MRIDDRLATELIAAVVGCVSVRSGALEIKTTYARGRVKDVLRKATIGISARSAHGGR